MTSRLHDQAYVAYLLGELDDAQRVTLEEEYFSDPDALEHLEAIETELIDAYVRGELPAERRAAFEQRYLASAEQRARVDASRRLQQPAAGGPRRHWIRSRGLAIAASLVVVAGALMVTQRTKTDVAPVTLDAPAPATEGSPQLVKSTEIVLPDPATRAAGRSADIRVPPSATTVRLRLPFFMKERQITLTGTVALPEGAVVQTTTDVSLGPDGQVSVAMPAASLGPGDYILTVSSGGSSRRVLFEQAFRVIR